MSAKEKKKVSKIALVLAIIMLLIIFMYVRFISNKETYATDEKENKSGKIEVSNAKIVNLEEIIQKNTKSKSGKDYEEDMFFVPFGYIMMFAWLVIMITAIILLRKNKANFLSFIIPWFMGLVGCLTIVFVMA